MSEWISASSFGDIPDDGSTHMLQTQTSIPCPTTGHP